MPSKNPFLRANVVRDFEQRQEEIDRKVEAAEISRVGGTPTESSTKPSVATPLESMQESQFNSRGSEIPENDPPTKDNFARTVRSWREPGETVRTNY